MVSFLIWGFYFGTKEFRLAARGNYTELFYPPRLLIILLSTSRILLLLFYGQSVPNRGYTPLRILELALSFFILCILIISKFIALILENTGE